MTSILNAAVANSEANLAPESPSSADARSGVLPSRVAALAIGLTATIFYLNSFWGSFVFDDDEAIVKNADIRHLWPPWHALFGPETITRPLVGLSIAINYAISGLKPWSYHLVNLMVHICAALVLYGVVRRTLISDRLRGLFGKDSSALALIVALIWLVHPLQTQSVTYIIQRCESMMGLFYLLCLYSSIRSNESANKKRWYVCAIAACAAGMLCKQVMVTAPVVVFLYDVIFTDRPIKTLLRSRLGLYTGLAATWVIPAATLLAAPKIQSAGFAVKNISSWGYLKAELGVILYYLRLSLWPDRLCLDYLDWPVSKTLGEVLPGALVVGGLGIATVWALVKRKPIAFLGVWFFLILSVTSSVVPIADFAFEHRMYLSLAAVVALIVLGLYSLAARLAPIPSTSEAVSWRKIAVIAAVATIVGLGFRTTRRNVDYGSEAVMWGDVVSKRPNNPRARANLGKALGDLGRIDEAIAQFREALRIDPSSIRALVNLGMAFYVNGRLADAKGVLLEAVSVDPADSIAHTDLGRVLADLGQPNDAAEQFRSAVQIKPDVPTVHWYLGNALVQLGQMDDAIKEYRAALDLDPGLESAKSNLGMALYYSGKIDEAREQLLGAVQLDPGDAEAHCSLGRILSTLRKTQEAADEFTAAIKINPGYAEAHLRLGSELEKEGRLDEAKDQYTIAARLRPEWAEKIFGHDAGKK